MVSAVSARLDAQSTLILAGVYLYDLAMSPPPRVRATFLFHAWFKVKFARQFEMGNLFSFFFSLFPPPSSSCRNACGETEPVRDHSRSSAYEFFPSSMTVSSRIHQSQHADSQSSSDGGGCDARNTHSCPTPNRANACWWQRLLAAALLARDWLVGIVR